MKLRDVLLRHVPEEEAELLLSLPTPGALIMQLHYLQHDDAICDVAHFFFPEACAIVVDERGDIHAIVYVNGVARARAESPMGKAVTEFLSKAPPGKTRELAYALARSLEHELGRRVMYFYCPRAQGSSP